MSGLMDVHAVPVASGSKSIPSFSFSPLAHTRALPLSSALLRSSPMFRSALRRFEADHHQFEHVEVAGASFVPRAKPVSRKAFIQDDEDLADPNENAEGWGDDEWSGGEAEGDDDESEAGDEWEEDEVVPQYRHWHHRRRSIALDSDDVSMDVNSTPTTPPLVPCRPRSSAPAAQLPSRFDFSSSSPSDSETLYSPSEATAVDAEGSVSVAVPRLALAREREAEQTEEEAERGQSRKRYPLGISRALELTHT